MLTILFVSFARAQQAEQQQPDRTNPLFQFGAGAYLGTNLMHPVSDTHEEFENKPGYNNGAFISILYNPTRPISVSLDLRYSRLSSELRSKAGVSPRAFGVEGVTYELPLGVIWNIRNKAHNDILSISSGVSYSINNYVTSFDDIILPAFTSPLRHNQLHTTLNTYSLLFGIRKKLDISKHSRLYFFSELKRLSLFVN